MRDYTDEEMFVEERLAGRLNFPKCGEIFQGILFSVLSTRDYKEFSSFIYALEEIGKVAIWKAIKNEDSLANVLDQNGLCL